MKTVTIFLFAAAILLLTACTTYVPGSTWLEKVEARYNQNIILDNDPDLCKKILKHTFADLGTLFIAEFWYANVRSSYKYVEQFHQEQEKQKKAQAEFKKKYIGKTRKQLIMEFGEPDYVSDDEDGGRILTWENATDESGYLAVVYQNVLATNRNARRTRSQYIAKQRIWFALDKSGKVYAVGFRTKTEAGSTVRFR